METTRAVATPELRRDPISGRLVAIAPARAHRPGASKVLIEPPTQAELDECPFCAGREDRTPPETLLLPPQTALPQKIGWSDFPGANTSDGGATEWKVRVVPNLYPAVERQEVVIHSREHKRSFADLSDEEIRLVDLAWQWRAGAARDEGFAYPFPLINEGRVAGSSLPHSHSQIVFLREPPPAAAARARADLDALWQIVEQNELLVGEENLTRAVVNPAGRLPYEILIGGSDNLGAELRLLRLCIRKLRALEGPVPWNAWHYDLYQHDERPGYMEVVPRLTVLAGLELGAGIYVNSLEPAEAAARLRAADPSSPSSPPSPGT